MGHYYNPPQPFVGGRQPAAPGPKLTPSGPTPDNPPLDGGARVPEEIHTRWIPQPVDQVLYRRVLPATAAVSAADNPPFRGTSVPREVLAHFKWRTPAAGAVATPAAAGPADNPPFIGGARISSEIMAHFKWPIPASPAGLVDFTPVVVFDNPPFVGGARVPREVLNAWIPAPPDQVLFTKRIYANDNPPFTGGARVPATVLSRWIPPAPDQTLFRRVTGSGPLPQNPPISGGARVSREILNRWIPPDPDRVYRRNPTFAFPSSTGPTGTLDETEGDDTASQRLSDIIQPYVPKRYPSIPGGEARHISDELRSVSTAFNRLLELSKELDARIASLGG